MRFVLSAKRPASAPPASVPEAPTGPTTAGQILFGTGQRMRTKQKIRRQILKSNRSELRQHNRTWLSRKRKLQRDMRRGVDKAFQKYGVTTYEMKKNLKKAEIKALRNLNRVKSKDRAKLSSEHQQRLRSVWRDSTNFDS